MYLPCRLREVKEIAGSPIWNRPQLE